jgi:hypothetical protein
MLLHLLLLFERDRHIRRIPCTLRRNALTASPIGEELDPRLDQLPVQILLESDELTEDLIARPKTGTLLLHLRLHGHGTGGNGRSQLLCLRGARGFVVTQELGRLNQLPHATIWSAEVGRPVHVPMELLRLNIRLN